MVAPWSRLTSCASKTATQKRRTIAVLMTASCCHEVGDERRANVTACLLPNRNVVLLNLRLQRVPGQPQPSCRLANAPARRLQRAQDQLLVDGRHHLVVDLAV